MEMQAGYLMGTADVKGRASSDLMGIAADERRASR
jgi:hypothetical protein